MRKEEEEEEWLYPAGCCWYIFSHLLYRFELVVQCCLRGAEIVLTAYKRTHILTGGLLFLASLSLETISIMLSSVLFLNTVFLH